ncbi:signal peptidase I [Clostridium grantii]|uniref:Signal peptidase I n=1 Tax=Clostridium grantii DSM 8605 TaxID=1121316 RepID=A0A1M5TGZ1_9CLOT|nr:signal peptidase I [Clostridium grantii]SHH50095.1 signal peptidase I [Clostridium grantii DSM 8605]
MFKDKIMKNEIIRDWIVPISIAIIIGLLFSKFVAFRAVVPTPSMEPTIKVGDSIIATKVYNKGNLKRGDILVFYSHELNATLTKRLIGLPGDTVEVKEMGQVFINGVKLEEPYVVNSDDLMVNFQVPEDKYLFMGDNRQVSFDSRRWTEPYIDAKDIKGKARFVLYPFKRFGKFVVGEEALQH